MMDFMTKVKLKAKILQKSIIFPETFDDRTLKAIAIVVEEELAKPVLLGKEIEIKAQAEKAEISVDWEKVTFVDLENEALLDKYAQELYELRKNKGLTLEEARKWVANRNYFAVMMMYCNDADGLVTGANVPSGDTYTPALQIIKTKKKFHKVSGVFFMVLEDRPLLFADCGITIDPNSHDLADIAIDTAETAKRFGMTPRIAMLSFGTNSHKKHPFIAKVKEAVAIIKDRRPDLLVEGEMQVDAALVPHVAEAKFPESKVAGQANVLIFPDLQSGNIAYKLVERLAGAKAIGPILQGLDKAINDLSRGCSVQDIVDLAAITACEAAEIQYELEQDAS